MSWGFKGLKLASVSNCVKLYWYHAVVFSTDNISLFVSDCQSLVLSYYISCHYIEVCDTHTHTQLAGRLMQLIRKPSL